MDLKGPNFEAVPPEIRIEIFKHLEIGDLGNIASINTQWQQDSQDSQFWKRTGQKLRLSGKVLKHDPKKAVQEEVERVKRLAQNAGIAKSNQPVTASHVRMLKLSAQLKFLEKDKKPPQSVKKLLAQDPTPESLSMLENWLKARTTFIVYKKLNSRIRSTQPIDPKILEGETWAQIPKHYSDWSEANREKLMSIKWLDLSGRQISAFDAGVFKNLVNLETLNLSKNDIADLPKGAFEDLKNLKLLDLSYNQLHAFSTDSLKSLTELNLSNNQIGGVEKEFIQTLEKLDILDMSGNKLRNLPQGFLHKQTKLARLDLSKNKIRDLDNEFLSTLVKLFEIDLSNNKLFSLPKGLFKNNINLRIIKLNFNQMISDDIIGDLRSCGIRVETEGNYL